MYTLKHLHLHATYMHAWTAVWLREGHTSDQPPSPQPAGDDWYSEPVVRTQASPAPSPASRRRGAVPSRQQTAAAYIDGEAHGSRQRL